MFIQEFLDLFATSTGMVINVTKSSIYLLNINEEEFSQIFSQLNFPLVEVEDGLYYLGFFLKSNAYLKMDCAQLFSKIEKRIILWCKKWLSRDMRMYRCAFVYALHVYRSCCVCTYNNCAYVHITLFCICASHIQTLLYMRIYVSTHICIAHIWVLVHMLKIYTSILMYILCIYISV